MQKIKITILLFGIAFFLNFGCKPKYAQGRVLYDTHCSNCHGKDGKGLKSLYPPIKDSDYLLKNIDQLPCIIRQGLEEKIIVKGKTYTTPMAGFPELNEVEITNIVNFIENNWLSKSRFNSLTDVKNKLDQCN